MKNRKKYAKYARIVASIAVIAMLLAACSGGAEQEETATDISAEQQDGAQAEASAESEPDSEETSADSAEGEAAAEERVAAAKGAVTFIDPGGEIDISQYAGEDFWIVSADLSIPFHQNIVEGFKSAAEAAGVNAVEFDGKGQTTEMARGIEQAISSNAAGIALISIDTNFVGGAITQANDADVPVIGVLNTDARAEPDEGTSGEATIDYTGSGELLTAYAIANTEGAVNALYGDVSEFRVMGFLREGIQQGFEEYCPDECTIQVFDTQMADFRNQVQNKSQSELRRNPDTNWMFSAFDGQAQFMVPALKGADFGDRVRVGSINAVQANLEFILNADVQAVDVGNHNAWLGWAALDRIFRGLQGDEGVSEVPIRLFDAENLEGLDITDEDDLFGGTDFRSEYQTLWGTAS